ncbi:sensor domain-containing diguanylate cyclase [Neisseriaceae bacterium TC5R-5]|nr:sensor domain-containing diguanylate cyclase [Neisseriaceae bacterium TC5R-5]
MITPQLPRDEVSRLNTLRSLQILDTLPEERFDRLTRLAKRLFDVPIVLISLVDIDRQWFKSAYGLTATQTERNISFCAHAILKDEILLVPDSLEDERFQDNPLVLNEPHIRFYAGCPLTALNGSKLGTLCLIDDKPRNFTQDDCAVLHDLAKLVEQEIITTQLASIDELTHLSNRRGFLTLGQYTLNMCTRLSLPAALLFIDLDHFKLINDNFGHAEGDKALINFSRILVETFRESDVIGRLGGDEFVVLMANCLPEDTRSAEQRLQEAITQFNNNHDQSYDIYFSLGCMIYNPVKHHTLELLLNDADTLMYECKRKKCNAQPTLKK